MMIKGLTRSGIGDAGSLRDFILAASAHGFGSVDAGGEELEAFLASCGGAEAARSWMREQGVVIGSIGLSAEWRQDEETFRGGLARLAQEAELAAALGCRACCTYILPATDHENAAHFMAVATRRLRTCARILGAHGIRLALEFVGPHHLRTAWTNPFIWTMDETLDWIDAIGERNVGLLVDSFHLHTTEPSMDALLKLTPEQIVHVHINDARPVPVEQILDNDRLYPGEGAIDLIGFLQALDRIGYKGIVAQEILTQQQPAESSKALMARSQAAFANVFRAAGLE